MAATWLKSKNVLLTAWIAGAALLTSVVVSPITLMLFPLLGSPLSDRYGTLVFDNPFFYTPWLVVPLLIGVVLGWFTEKLIYRGKSKKSKLPGLMVGIATVLLVLVLESLARKVRLAQFNFSWGAVLSSVYSPRLFLVNYLLMTVGLILGVLVGIKAYRENHRIRLYTFSALLLIMIVATQVYFWQAGLDVYNPFSPFRGVF